eukprot:gb/GEZN01014827.1/.p1 GENE.gb/GEZN01014827.1/~~gb/GEZN01014827.1/.p1  ORF type:complete len:266 (+),score=42.31 gb/GEZN01014827.1/:43-840(+)
MVDRSTTIDMKVVGILDGISHQSGVDYFLKINDKIQATTKYKYAGNTSRCLMYSVNLEEYVSYLAADRMDIVAELLTEGALRLKKGGADFLVIASNTGHSALPRMMQAIPHWPVLHIADCCAKHLLKHNIHTTALVGTKYTMQQRYLIDRLEAHGLKVVVPRDKKEHDELERVIEKELSFGKFQEKSRKWLVNVIRSDCIEKQNAQAVILGCTEIGMLIKQTDIPEILVLDSAEAHIDGAVEVQLGRKSVFDFYPTPNNKALSKL